jgi:hypothetical protein
MEKNNSENISSINRIVDGLRRELDSQMSQFEKQHGLSRYFERNPSIDPDYVKLCIFSELLRYEAVRGGINTREGLEKYAKYLYDVQFEDPYVERVNYSRLPSHLNSCLGE